MLCLAAMKSVPSVSTYQYYPMLKSPTTIVNSLSVAEICTFSQRACILANHAAQHEQQSDECNADA